MFTEFTKRQEEIIRVSLELIDCKGTQGLTIKNIAKNIGTVESAIYRHFSGKNQILHAIIDLLQKNSLPKNYIEDKEIIPQIEKNLNKQFQSFVNLPALVSVFFSDDLFQNNDSLAEKTKKIYKTSLREMEKIIKIGQDKGELRTDISPEYLSIIITSTFRMFLKQWKMSNHSFNLIEKGNELIESIKLIIKKS